MKKNKPLTMKAYYRQDHITGETQLPLPCKTVAVLLFPATLDHYPKSGKGLAIKAYLELHSGVNF